MVVDCIDFFRDDYEMVGQIFAALRSTYYSPKLDDMLTLPPAPLWARLQEPVELFATLVGGLKVDTIRHHAPSTIADMLQAIRPSDEALVVGWLRESRRALDLLLDAVLQLGTHASFRSIPMRLNPHHEDEIRARVFCTLRNFIATPANALRLAVESGLLAAIAPKPGPHSVAHVVALLDDLRSRLDSVRASLRPRLGAAAGVAMAVLRGYGPNERAVRERWFALVRAFDLDAADEALRMCGGCGVTGRDGKLWRCGGCGKRWSCSRSCQRLDWGSHRKRCSGGACLRCEVELTCNSPDAIVTFAWRCTRSSGCGPRLCLASASRSDGSWSCGKTCSFTGQAAIAPSYGSPPVRTAMRIFWTQTLECAVPSAVAPRRFPQTPCERRELARKHLTVATSPPDPYSRRSSWTWRCWPRVCRSNCSAPQSAREHWRQCDRSPRLASLPRALASRVWTLGSAHVCTASTHLRPTRRSLDTMADRPPLPSIVCVNQRPPARR